jgi:hypothetical protein
VYTIVFKNVKGDSLAESGIDVEIILKWMLEKSDVRV